MKQGARAQNNNAIFNSGELWTDYDRDQLIQSVKIPLILSNIPRDTASILDIGCGNGLITNRLSQQFDVTGIDLSEEALRHVQTKTIVAPAHSVPLGEASADLVFASELLEHLPGTVLHETVAEFKRLSRKYILITVPNREFLPKSYLKCADCHTVFHTSGHVNSFSIDDIDRLFRDRFDLIGHGYFGKKVREYHPLLQWVKHRYCNQWAAISSQKQCPDCQSSRFETGQHPTVVRLCNGMNRMVSGHHPYWLFALFQKHQK